MPDALRFCFDVCAQDALVEGAALDIVETLGRALCRDCGGEVALSSFFGCCPCGSTNLRVILMSSPGSGKTNHLERTIAALQGTVPVYVVEGDQATTNDAERIRATGCPVIQVNTGTGCHLEADMLARGIARLKPERGSLVLIANVGNLVCPALFDLGERAKVVILSVAEGEDKPAKYPHMFRACEVMLINKTDLLPHVRFDVERCIGYARQTNPGIRVFQVSAETGEGMRAWYEWLLSQVPGRQGLHGALAQRAAAERSVGQDHDHHG